MSQDELQSQPQETAGEGDALAVEEAEGLLRLAAEGDAVARDRLLGIFYGELRRIAGRVLAQDQAVISLQPTELLHEAAMRLMRLDRLRWNDHGHFLALCTRLMRQVLIDEVRRVRADKRRHIAVTTSFAHAIPEEAADFDIEALDSALNLLAEVKPDLARLVELRFFVGLTTEEAARLLEVSESTVKREWRVARAWLLARLQSA